MAGLPWIPLDVDFPTGRKAVALGVALENPWAWALVVRLWTEAARKAADGRIEGPAAVQTIELWAGWTGSPGQFVEACCLPHVALIDHTDRGFYIHDWHEHCGAHIEKMKKDRERKRRGTSAEVPWNRDGTAPEFQREREREKEREKDLLPRETTPLVSFLAATYRDIADPWACEDAWSKAYPAVDLLAESLRAKAWEAANPKKAKADHARFLNAWFKRAQADAEKHPLRKPASSLRWWDRLSPDDLKQYDRERAAIDPELEGAPYGAVGVNHTAEVAALHERWSARVQREACA